MVSIPSKRIEESLIEDLISGVGNPRKSVTGKRLPDARLVSSRVHRDLGFHDHAVTLMFLGWGQLLDHDVTFTQEAKSKSTVYSQILMKTKETILLFRCRNQY
jgi:peroxidase